MKIFLGEKNLDDNLILNFCFYSYNESNLLLKMTHTLAIFTTDSCNSFKSEPTVNTMSLT